MKTTDRTLTKEAPQEVCFFFCKSLVVIKDVQNYNVIALTLCWFFYWFIV